MLRLHKRSRDRSPAKKKLENHVKDIECFTIKGTGDVVQVGDNVLMQPPGPDDLPYVAKVVKIEEDDANNVRVLVRWYYRPEESVKKRRIFHGEGELFQSDHCDFQSINTINGKCSVHTIDDYIELANVGDDDYYSRYTYNAEKGKLLEDITEVNCLCDLPCNPDEIMVECEMCGDWFHPKCVGITEEEAKSIPHFCCPICSPTKTEPKTLNAVPAIPNPEVPPKKRKMYFSK